MGPVVFLLLAHAFAVDAQVPDVAPNAPPDMPVRLVDEQVSELDRAIQPYVEEARSTYPSAKARFEDGLPVGQSFFITTRIFESPKVFEQVFIAVQSIENDVVHGLVWNDIRTLNGYRRGDEYSFPESQLIDWLITRPDGTEEGNYVGKFLDTYQPR